MTLAGRKAFAVLAALALSLVLNFGLAGFLIARALPDRNPPSPAERLSALGPRALPGPLRAAVAQRLRPDAPELRAAFGAVRDARQAVFATMRADPYDRASAEAALAELRARLAAVTALGEDAVLDVLDTAPADVRARIGGQTGKRGG